MIEQKKYFISIGEPWDFEGPDGQNKIIGIVIKEISENALIFKSDKIQTFKEGTGNIFLLLSRYNDEVLIKKNSKGNNEYIGTVGGSLINAKDYLNKERKALEKEGTYVFIGGINVIA